jgi:ABC-2 type transport system ATP-binding protein
MSPKPSKTKPTSPSARSTASPKAVTASSNEAVAAKRRAVAAKPKPGTAAYSSEGDASSSPAGTVAAKPRPARTPALDSLSVAKSYGELTALAPLDLFVEQGEAVVLIGHNGSGKTTFLRMASGLLEASDGRIEIGGHAAGSLPARSAVSYLSDSPTFYEDLSVWEHIEFTARLHGRTDWEQDAADVLGHLGIYHRADDLPSRFSRGLKQKAAIAIGLIRPMDLLLVDEPFVGLDAAGKGALLELLDDLHAQGVALVVATHELEYVKRVGRCIALRDGELIHDGPVADVDVMGLVQG